MTPSLQALARTKLSETRRQRDRLNGLYDAIDGVPPRRVWARVKCRPYVDEDLITALFLGAIGRRWGGALKPLFVGQALKDGDRPLFPEEPLPRIAAARLHRRSRHFLTAAALEDGHGYGPNEMLDALATVEAESRLNRAFGGGTFAAQADAADVYPSVSHELLGVMSRLGVPPRWLEFFGRFLMVPVRGAGRLRRGLPLEHTLADVFAECLLWALGLRVWLATRAQLTRVVDDAWVVAPTRAALDAQLAEGWERFYVNVGARLDPADPAPMPAMERLLSDFIGRGGEVSGRPQVGLTPSWRWVVYTYGPSLLEALGTFRFLMTELVPL